MMMFQRTSSRLWKIHMLSHNWYVAAISSKAIFGAGKVQIRHGYEVHLPLEELLLLSATS
jgi:hypothetical protein